MLNKVMLIGNLGADPDARFTQDGACVCNLRLATTEKFKNKAGEKVEKTEWHRVVMWGRLGEIANQYLGKGSKIYIEGKIETRKWTNKEGLDQYTTEIRANEMKMLGGGPQNSNQAGHEANSFPDRGGSNPAEHHPGAADQANQAGGKQTDPFANAPDFGDVPVDDDIPF